MNNEIPSKVLEVHPRIASALLDVGIERVESPQRSGEFQGSVQKVYADNDMVYVIQVRASKRTNFR